MSFEFIKRVGVETEIHARILTPELVFPLTVSGHGKSIKDAGANLLEIVTDPHDSPERAEEATRAVLARLQEVDLAFQACRPADWNGHNEWTNDPRYGVMQYACEIEVGRLNAKKLQIMTSIAALHLNVSGDFDPVGFEGVFLADALNNAAPYIAAKIHEALGDGEGHLSHWCDFALKERFPAYEWWFGSPNNLRIFFEALPRFFKCEGDLWTPRPHGEFQEFGVPLDHGVFWHFARQKPIPGTDEWYMELRFLASMDAHARAKYSPQVVGIADELLVWHGLHKKGEMVTRDEAVGAFAHVHARFPDIFPPKPLTKEEWHTFLQQ